MSDGSKLFETVHTSVASYLTCRKRGIDGTKILEAVIGTLKASSNVVSKDEQFASAGAVIVASKLLLAETETNEKVQLIQLFSICLDVLETFENISSFKWSNLHPIFSGLLPSIPTDSPSAMKFVKFFEKILKCMNYEKISRDFYSPPNMVTLSMSINTFLGIYENKNRDVELRKSSLKCLAQIFENFPTYHVWTFTTIIPGVLSKLFNTLTKPGGNENVEIMEKSVELFEKCVVKGFSDESFDGQKERPPDIPKQLQKLFADRNDEKWRDQAAENIRKYMTHICGNLTNHRAYSLKGLSLQMVKNVQESCGTIFRNTLFPMIVDLYLVSVNDRIENVQRIGKSMKELVDRIYFEKRLYEKLDELIVTIPTATRDGQSESSLLTLTAVIEGIGESLEMLCKTRSDLMLSLFKSLADSLKIETKRLMITRVEGNVEIIDQLRKFPLMYDVKIENVEIVCKSLAKYGTSEILDILQSEMLQSSISQKCSFAILMTLIVKNLDKNEIDETLVLIIAEYFIKLIEQIADKRLKSDEKVEDLSYQLNQDSCLECLICLNFGLFFGFYEDEEQKSKKLIDILYILLLECSSPTWIIVESAQFAIDEISKTCHLTRQEMLSKHGGYVIHKISLACSSSVDHHFAPLVFQSFLQQCEDPKFFENCLYIVQKMLDSLDEFQQKYTINILEGLRVFVKTVNFWFPVMEPILIAAENEDEEEKPIPNSQMIIVEKILNRTKHMLNSHYLPIKITTLEIVNEALYTLRNFDDFLLPMVHQNWQSLMQIVKGGEQVELLEVVMVMKRMAQVAKSFIQRRILLEFWPEMEKFVVKEAVKSNIYTQTTAFKLLKLVFSTFPDICILVEMDKQQIESSIGKVLEIGKSGHPDIRKICEIERVKLDEYLKNSNECN